MTILRCFEAADPALVQGGHDPLLLAFLEDLEWLKASGVGVQRYNATTDAEAFAATAQVKAELDRHGDDALPILLAGDRVLAVGEYPDRAALAQAFGLSWLVPSSVVGVVVTELVSLAAAVASDCQPAFQVHLQRARRLGVDPRDLLKVANLAFSIKAVPHRGMIELAERVLLPAQGGCGSGGCGCGDGGCDPEACDCEEGGCGEGSCGCGG